MKKKYLSCFLSAFFFVNCSNENSSSEIKSNNAPETANPNLCDTQKTDDSACEWGGFKIKVSTKDIVKTVEKAGTDIDREVIRVPVKVVDKGLVEVDKSIIRKTIDEAKNFGVAIDTGVFQPAADVVSKIGQGAVDALNSLGEAYKEKILHGVANSIAKDPDIIEKFEKKGWDGAVCVGTGYYLIQGVVAGYSIPICTAVGAATGPTGVVSAPACEAFVINSGYAITGLTCAILCANKHLKC